MERGPNPSLIGRRASSWDHVSQWRGLLGRGFRGGCGLGSQYSSAMASEKPLVAVTCTAPVNIAVIKYCECAGRGLHGGRQPGVGGRWKRRGAVGGPYTVVSAAPSRPPGPVVWRAMPGTHAAAGTLEEHWPHGCPSPRGLGHSSHRSTSSQVPGHLVDVVHTRCLSLGGPGRGHGPHWMSIPRGA